MSFTWKSPYTYGQNHMKAGMEFRPLFVLVWVAVALLVFLAIPARIVILLAFFLPANTSCPTAGPTVPNGSQAFGLPVLASHSFEGPCHRCGLGKMLDCNHPRWQPDNVALTKEENPWNCDTSQHAQGFFRAEA